MFAGFDYGSSNCAIGVSSDNTTPGNEVHLVPLYQQQAFVPSCLYALSRELIPESVARTITDATAQESYMASRTSQLRLAGATRRELGIPNDEQVLFIGEEAISNYVDWPEEGYFVKSPKSFLGASGLRQQHLDFFEDVVTAMMQQLKGAAEKQLGYQLEQTVIGRPVNFQGSQAETANQQACQILDTAARRAGFKQVELLFEPIAAGLDFETTLQQDRLVLVVDVGGGTTDCSMVRMGPSYCHSTERSQDFLGHSGSRVGGNDLDINLAYKGLMPLFGLNDLLKTGKPLPSQPFWNAVSVNDIAAQAEFSALPTTELIKQLILDAKHPVKVERLQQLQQKRQNYQLVRSAEQCKIALSNATEQEVGLDYIEDGLTQPIDAKLYAEAVTRPVDKIVSLMEEVIAQAACQPDLVYVTGGTAQSPVVREAIERCLGQVPVMNGDHFGSVAAGLTKWAARIYR